VTVNVNDLERAFESGAEVNPETLHAKNLARARWDQLKVLGNGALTKKLTVCAHRFSETAKAKIEQAGGEVVILPAPTPVKEKKKQKRQDAAGTSA
jgi:large subunit ribosomal protein L15